MLEANNRKGTMEIWYLVKYWNREEQRKTYVSV